MPGAGTRVSCPKNAIAVVALHARSMRLTRSESPPKLAIDKVLQKTVNTHKGIAEFDRLHSVPAHIKPGVYGISGSLLFRACDNKICTLQREKPFRTQIKILGKV